MFGTIHQICILDDYSNFTVPKNVETIKNTIKSDYKLWKEQDILALIEQNFSTDVLKAYKLLKSNAFKADLARYCILYVYGGWYFDLLMTIDGTVGHYNLNDYDMLVFRDIAIVDRSLLPVSNSAIWVKNTKNPVLKNVIDVCTENILKKSYPKNSHRITGPVVFGSELAKECLNNSNTNILVGDLTFDSESGCGVFIIPSFKLRKNIHFGWFRLPGLEKSLPSNYQKGSVYTAMYNKRDIYND